MSSFTIKVLSESDWHEYKLIRLKSLLDSPDSFGSTHKQEVSLTDEKWRSRLSGSLINGSLLTVAAIVEKTYIGLLSGVINESNVSNAHLYQMWVDPQYRGMGVGTALVKNVRTWSSSNRAKKMILSVTTTNEHAISLYQSIGFEPVGALEPLRPNSELQSQVMEMKLQ